MALTRLRASAEGSYNHSLMKGEVRRSEDGSSTFFELDHRVTRLMLQLVPADVNVSPPTSLPHTWHAAGRGGSYALCNSTWRAPTPPRVFPLPFLPQRFVSLLQCPPPSCVLATSPRG